MKKKFLFLVFVSYCFSCFAQNVKKEESQGIHVMSVPVPPDGKTDIKKELNLPKVKLYGFVRNYFYYDSRENLQSSGGLFNQIPKNKNLNSFGEDLNEVGSSRFLAITTRLGLNISGPEIFGAETSAKIETDFNGFSGSTTMLRIRHAYFKLAWNQNLLLCGQTWHPMFGDVLPDVLGLATGSPFQPFSRTPQIRYDYRIQKIDITLAALYQLQYLSVGPDGASASYANEGILPELYVGLDYKSESFLIGSGLDFLRIRPRVTGDRSYTSENGEQKTEEVKVSDYLLSFSPMFYIQYNRNLFTIKAKSVYGQNTAHLNMMSGYGVTKENKDGSREYTNLNSTTSWLDISYGKKYKVNFFLGYSKNLGASKDIIGDIYVRGYKNIDQFYRISPAFSYNLKHFNLGVEYELTTVAYGTNDKKGKVKDTHDVSNNRVCAMVKYNF